ncbi:hypothetical protein [Clostridium sp.]|uniref:hypothetical protein n=1 Tax=Clostridium sp. TaxID=1506 RepID=UPI001A580720|nr:hypothetical protein [Clostridium sp.]MBK5242806.1 hypothetical protein [Clostridium sp.]
MKNLVRNHKFLVSFAVFSILAVGCSSKQPANEKSTNNNKSSETITSTDKVEKDTNSKINAGLLIGLSKNNEINDTPMKKTPNDYRTLWIYEDNEKITYKKKNEIIAPYKDSFYKIGNNKFIMSDPISHSENQPEDIFSNFSSYYNFSNIVSHPANTSMSNLFTPDTFKKKYLNAQEGSMGDAYKLQIQKLYYVGNNYASIRSNYYDTGGGTYNSSYDDFKIYEIGNLSNLDRLDNSEPLFNLLDKSEQLKLKGYSRKYDKNISLDGYIKVDQVIDSENLQLFRSEGKWQVSIPLFRIYRHNGNGSNGKTVKEYINTDIKLPTKITSYDSLCIEWDEIKQKIPQAKDAVSSPNDDMLAVLTPSKLLVFTNPKLGIDKPSLSIDVDENESIILNQWATGEYVDKWTKLISDY